MLEGEYGGDGSNGGGGETLLHPCSIVYGTPLLLFSKLHDGGDGSNGGGGGNPLLPCSIGYRTHCSIGSKLPQEKLRVMDNEARELRENLKIEADARKRVEQGEESVYICVYMVA
jgi:hypothetical protein